MDVPSFIQLAHYCIVSRLLLLEIMPQGTTWYIRPVYAGMPSGLPLLGQKINAFVISVVLEPLTGQAVLGQLVGCSDPQFPPSVKCSPPQVVVRIK